MSDLNYGTLKPRRRRPSWLALIALLIPCVLALVAGVTYALYKSPPPPNSGFDGLAWFLGVLSLFGFLLRGTYVGAPTSIMLALLGLAVIRENPHRLLGRTCALLAILMSVLLIVGVSIARHRVDQAFNSSGPAGATPATRAASTTQGGP